MNFFGGWTLSDGGLRVESMSYIPILVELLDDLKVFFVLVELFLAFCGYLIPEFFSKLFSAAFPQLNVRTSQLLQKFSRVHGSVIRICWHWLLPMRNVQTVVLCHIKMLNFIVYSVFSTLLRRLLVDRLLY